MSKKSGYFAPLVTLAHVIDAPGRYLTRGGEVVTVTAVSSKHDFGNVGTYPNNIREGWHRSGRLYAGMKSQNDIVGKAS